MKKKNIQSNVPIICVARLARNMTVMTEVRQC